MSYYQSSKNQSVNSAIERSELAGAASFDVCVVGAGISGLSAALQLHQRGYSVALLEAEDVGHGASGRSGGQGLMDVACGYQRLRQLVGEADADKIFQLTVAALQLIRQRVRDYQIDCDLVSGCMTVAQKPRQDRDLLEELEIYARQGQSLQHYKREQLRAIIASDVYTSGIYNREALHLHPLNYTLGLAHAFTGSGGRLFTGTRVSHFQQHAKGIKVYTPRGRVDCQHLLLAGNCYLGSVAPQIQRRIMPVGTYIAATKPLGAEAASLISNNCAVCDSNFVLDYFRLSADQRLLFGGRVSYSGLQPLSLRRSIYQRLVRVFPRFKQQSPEQLLPYAWGGYVDITMNRAPDFGRLGGAASNIYYLQGFSGHGIALSNIAGKIAAEAIDHNASNFDLFARIKHRDFPGGRHLRTPMLVLAMLWYRLRDWL